MKATEALSMKGRRSNSQAVHEALTSEIPRLREENAKLKEENAKLLTRVSELDGEAQQLREQLWDMGVGDREGEGGDLS